jgi:hypothetical protein
MLICFTIVDFNLYPSAISAPRHPSPVIQSWLQIIARI